jgi:hypothetical protein
LANYQRGCFECLQNLLVYGLHELIFGEPSLYDVAAKKRDAEEVKDFCLISLIHNISKLIAKTLSLSGSRYM